MNKENQLYTRKQMVQFANDLLARYQVKYEDHRQLFPEDKEPRTGQVEVSHADIENFRDKYNISPLQSGQMITISTIDGLQIYAEIEAIEDKVTEEEKAAAAV